MQQVVLFCLPALLKAYRHLVGFEIKIEKIPPPPIFRIFVAAVVVLEDFPH